MQMFLAAALFAATGLAMPAGSFQCGGGLTNSSPMCCATNILQLAALDCRTPGADGCPPGLKKNCCTLGLANLALICNPV
ncbi:hydrophobin [Akanthomyces lecanii RCEF 1005]|uniref:Hydrophobin n=1 Tax=Akanthomyces lecanii RCEF 1005 TaxID=1081108 RepID=A0A168GJI9_CORDF|nr:hydrophobin [Akanthomyces lecanii RCEF 1005]